MGGSHYTTRAGPSRRRVPLFFPYLHKTTSLCRRVPCSPRSQIHLKLKFKSIASILQFLNFFRSSISAPSSPGFKPDSHDDPPRARAAGGRRWAREAAQNGVLGRPRDRKVSAPSCRPPLSNRPTLFTSPYSNFRPGLMSRGGLVPSQLPPAGGRRWAREAAQNGVLDAPEIAKFQLPRAAPLYPTGPPCPPSRTATFGRGSCPAVAWCRLSCLRSSRALGASHLLAVPSFVLPSCRSLAPPPCGAPPRQKANVLIGLDAPLSRLWSCCTRSPAVYVARAPPYEARPPSNPVWLRLRVACAVRAGMRNGTAQTVGSALDGDL